MSYSPIIQKTIKYIENNLQEDLTLEIIARFAGFSKYHYHRIFQKEVGVSISEYIRYRRIANSASLLLYTDQKIIDIALFYRFESQESYTRSFKRYYNLPPGQYRQFMGKLIFKKEEMKMKNDQLLKGWQFSGSHPFNYQMGIDREVFHQGKASGFLKSVTVEEQGEFATMMQQFKADKYLGKRLKFSGFIKSEAVDGFCGFWMRVDDHLQDVLHFDNMSDRPIKGDNEWNLYSIVLDVPENSAVISFGILLSGKGHVWVDGITFEEVDSSISTTNIDFSSELLDEPINLSFDECEGE
ncbi:MAG TPA: AraC family transcriptional regulator [Bacillus bacterium]|uniref:HTH-type transcriptional regulator YbfP n=1 Tax=Siminovitchia fordii TaxID=254759 RepID=A0ABQ4K7G3_9BACI|nr:AraC family transcriptional regulator [Siminovitchia fordii]GIN20975.1 putative HTH-type transcriptional regulator YbfP [Siminovitchia fordii]HBZ09328.1 AraC family transcriptional regulator [Bacillus sp. (in: firmicutes)]